jgi:intracellular multiplication protein IcmD
MNKIVLKTIILCLGALTCFVLGVDAFAVTSGIAGVASQVTGNLGGVAKLITAGSYVAGMGFAVGAVVKFKAHKDNPTQITIGQPIALLFVAAALMFIPSVFKTAGGTLFGASGGVAGISGVQSFTGQRIGS